MQPMVKYRGGKSKEIPHFESYFPSSFDMYYEPFFGGGAVFFYLQPQKAIINDINARLMNFYREMQQNYATARCQLDHLQRIYRLHRQAAVMHLQKNAAQSSVK